MNRSYFTDRQDRYLHFPNQPSLAEYATSYAETFAPFTHRLVPIPGGDTDIAHRLEWINAQAGPTAFEANAKMALESLQSRWRLQAAKQPAVGDTSLFPIIQSGVIGVREEEAAIDHLFEVLEQAPGSSTVDLTSGYFGLYAPYKRRVLCSSESVQWRIIAASPKVGTSKKRLFRSDSRVFT